MARPVTITDEQILKAARDVFLEKGVSGTTAEVARRAGIAEGSIFKRFATKQELFHRALDLESKDPEFLRALTSQVGKGDIEQNLFDCGKAALAFFRKLMPLIMMSWSNRSQRGLPQILQGPNPPPVRVLKRMSSYFDAEMRLGRLRRHDPEIMARVFIGSIQNYYFFEMLLNQQDQLPMPEEMFIRGVIHLIWNGAASEAVAPRRRVRR